ncbi:MAG: hypothetical protein LBB87_05220 [Nitrososphaerota archaeon]|jgi:uncharacterized membrane protein required for colicin V production|nr:hypothetical protein [Nitrososphaerota archaeon]
MDQRIKIFGIIAIIGFIAGIIASLALKHLVPWLREVLPSLSNFTDYLIAGIVGAILAVILIAVWVRISGKQDNYY